jgi:hypothetical protein
LSKPEGQARDDQGAQAGAYKHFARVLVDLVESGEWAKLTDAEKAMLPVLLIKADASGRCGLNTALLARMAGLHTRGVQLANQRLASKGRIKREWDGDHRRAGVNTINSECLPHLAWGPREVAVKFLREKLVQAADDASKAAAASVPADIDALVRQRLQESPTAAWDEVPIDIIGGDE